MSFSYSDPPSCLCEIPVGPACLPVPVPMHKFDVAPFAMGVGGNPSGAQACPLGRNPPLLVLVPQTALLLPHNSAACGGTMDGQQDGVAAKESHRGGQLAAN